MNKEPYLQLKEISDSVYRGGRQKWASDAICILTTNSILLRDKDGKPHSVNLSIPISIKDALVLGVRYLKKDGTFTEDIFIFKMGEPIKPFYKKRIEEVLPEYKGTHKKQSNF